MAGNHVLWRLSHSKKMHRVKIRLGFLFLFRFFFRSFFSLGLNLQFFAKNESLFVLFRFFFVFFALVKTGPYRAFNLIQRSIITLAHSDEPYMHNYGNSWKPRFHELEHESNMRLLNTHSHTFERQGNEAGKVH